MDKRWIYILIILIIGFSALYYIVVNSTTIGSAIVGINAFIFTIPDSFNIENSDHGFASLVDRDTNEHILVKELGKGKSFNKSIEKELLNVESDEDVKRISSTTEKYKDMTSKVINYEKEPNGTVNKVAVFSKFNHTFLIKSTNFKDVDTLNEKTHFIMDTIKQDHKKKQS